MKLAPTLRAAVLAALLVSTTFATPIARAQLPDASPGRDVYLQYCATCHGTDLNGGLGPNLVDDETLHGAGTEDMAHVVRGGVLAAGMPAFGEVLSDAQIRDVVRFISSVRAAPETAPVATTIDTLATLDYALGVEVFADDLDEPWAIDFVDPRTALVTEKAGRLRVVRDGRLLPDPVAGTPPVAAEGQGGLLDVTVDPAVEGNGWVYLSYSHALDEGDGERPPAMTRIVRGRIRDNHWVDEEVLFEAPHETYRTTRHHYGNRIVFDPDGYLFFSIGDRGAGDQAQDLGRPNGKIHRILPDGTVPPDNPFADRPGALPSIYSYGHRNPQGLTVDASGQVWAVEHGPRGGDELNRVVAGRNYGWPVITYGINYDGTVITEERRRPGMEQPALYWRPSIAVSGLEYYDGDLFPMWRGHLLVGALRQEELRLLDVHDGRVLHQEVVLKDAGRVREAVVGLDGAVYVVLNDPHRVVRLVPREARITN